jgi:hypothetical protein
LSAWTSWSTPACFALEDLSDRAELDRHLAVNLYGIYDVTRAFLSALTRWQGAVVTIGSVAALTPIPLTALCGPVDTEMVRDLLIPKSSPGSVARAIFDGIGDGEEDIFPDSLSGTLAEGETARREPRGILPGTLLVRLPGTGVACM